MTPLISPTAKTNPQALKSLSIALYQARITLSLGGENKKLLFELIHHIIAAIIANTDFHMKVAPPQPRYGYSHSIPIKSHSIVLELIKHCFSFEEEAPALCSRVTRRIQPIQGVKIMDWFSQWFKPFIEELRIYLESKGQSLSAEPFRSCVSGNVRLVIESGVGKKPVEKYPRDLLGGFGCGCEQCQAIRLFLLDGRSIWTVGAVQGVRTHLERQLASARNLGLTWRTVHSGRPYQLEVHISPMPPLVQD